MTTDSTFLVLPAPGGGSRRNNLRLGGIADTTYCRSRRVNESANNARPLTHNRRIIWCKPAIAADRTHDTRVHVTDQTAIAAMQLHQVAVPSSLNVFGGEELLTTLVAILAGEGVFCFASKT